MRNLSLRCVQLALVAAAVLLTPAQAAALTVMSINAEWFWDELARHEGHIAIGPAGNPPSRKQVELEAFAIAQLIRHHDADIVGLVEVENGDVVQRIRNYLPDGWTEVFVGGRDHFTGQDVALLTRWAVIPGTPDNFETAQPGNFPSGSRTARPSKVLAAGLEHSGDRYYVVVAHLISKRSGNDDKRFAQADAIRHEVIENMTQFDHVIMMGDMNDTPGSPALSRLRGVDDAAPELAQPATTTGPQADFSDIHEGDRELIDHVLISSSLGTSHDFRSVDLGPISDHRAVILEIP